MRLAIESILLRRCALPYRVITALGLAALAAGPAAAASFTLLPGTGQFNIESMLAWEDVLYLGTYENGVQTLGLDGQGLKSTLAERGNCFDAQGSRVYVGTDDGVHLTEDKGATWRRLGNMQKDETVLSLAVKGDTLFAGTFLGLYVSRDGGASWERTGADRITSWTEAVAASGDLVYAGSGDMFTGIRLSRSEDGGKTWKAATWNGAGREIVGIRFLGTHLLVATNSGLNFSADKGTTWTVTPGQGYVYNAGSFFDAILNVSDGALFFASDSRGWVSFDNGLNWSTIVDPPDNYAAFAKSGTTLWTGTSKGLYSSILSESIPVRPPVRGPGRQAPATALTRAGGALLAPLPGGKGSARMDGRRTTGR